MHAHAEPWAWHPTRDFNLRFAITFCFAGPLGKFPILQESHAMSNCFDLSGKNAIVTGATRGIGLAIVRGYAEAGANVTLCGRKQETVDAALAELGAVKDKVLGVVAHVGKNEDLEKLLGEAEKKFGPVNVLVNNAGTNPYFGPILESEDRAWDKTMDVNLKGPYVLSRMVAKKMVQTGGGSILNIASVAGLQAAVYQGIYSVSKAGLIMLTKVMARELGRQKIRVNCICPGVIRTHLAEALWKDEGRLKEFVKNKSLGRIGETEEIVGAAIYFASDASSFTTGAALVIDGGMVI
jgi:NAD(P)-dependent dehydrogenase (short-subunit alcohol dehydrogenase family)